MGEIIVDNGQELFTIKNKQGKILGEIWMNPTDMEIVKRYDQTARNLEKISEAVDADKPEEEILYELEERVKHEIDYLFNAEVSESFFSITSPFTVLASGEFFIENVINAIGAVLEAKTGERMSRIKARVSKYTEKYHV